MHSPACTFTAELICSTLRCGGASGDSMVGIVAVETVVVGDTYETR